VYDLNYTPTPLRVQIKREVTYRGYTRGTLNVTGIEHGEGPSVDCKLSERKEFLPLKGIELSPSSPYSVVIRTGLHPEYGIEYFVAILIQEHSNYFVRVPSDAVSLQHCAPKVVGV
jgi:hypothetical protein